MRRRVVQYAPLTSLLDVMFILVFASLIHSASLEARARQAVVPDVPTRSQGAGDLAVDAADKADHADASDGRVPPPLSEDGAVEASGGDPTGGGVTVAGTAGATTVGPLPPRSPVELRQTALLEMNADLERRRAVIAHISRDGRVRSIERPLGPTDDARGDSVIEVNVPLLDDVAEPDIRRVYLGDKSAELRLCSLIRLQLGLEDLSDVLVVITPDAPLAELSLALVRGLQRDARDCAEHQGIAVIVEPASPAQGSTQAPASTAPPSPAEPPRGIDER